MSVSNFFFFQKKKRKHMRMKEDTICEKLERQ